jgi:hypothetical protein
MRLAAVAALLAALAGCLLTTGSAAATPFDDVAPANSCPAVAKPLGLIADGDFHGAPEPSRDGLKTYSLGQYIPGTAWQVSQRTVDLYGTAYRMPDEVCSLDLDGTPGDGAITHDPVPTIPGTTYTLGFLLSGNGTCKPRVKRLLVSAAGQSAQFEWNDRKHNDAHRGRYEAEHWQFKATAAATAITLASADGGAADTLCGPVVTDISLDPA